MNASLQAILLASVATILIPTFSVAQPPGDSAFKKVKLLKERLDLTDEQADSIYSVLKKYNYKQCDDIASFTKKNACFKEVHSTKHARMTSVLTEKQKVEFEEFIVECQENHGPRSKAPGKKSGEKVSCSS